MNNQSGGGIVAQVVPDCSTWNYINIAGGSMEDRIIREAECRKITGLGRTTRHRYEKAGTFPNRRQLGSHSVGWLLSEVLEWMRTRDIIGGDNESD